MAPLRSAEVRALPLVGLIYEAASRPERWNDFVRTLADDLGDAAVVMNVELPNWPASARSYRVNSEDRFGKVFADLAREGEVPWPLAELVGFDRFVWSEEYLTSDELAKTPLYERYMKPQGLLCEGQIGHVLAEDDGRPLAAIGIYRREGGRPLTVDDSEMLDLLVPHLGEAYRIHCELRDTRHRHAIVAEAIDRFPMAVLFIDRDLRVVESNRAAQRMAAQGDGFTIEDGIPQATASVSATEFASVLERGLESVDERGIARSILSIERPSGKKPYEALVATLANASPIAQPRQAMAVLFVADSEDQRLHMPDVLSTLYHLTPAEAELATLLFSGKSVEEAAKARNVKTNTARAQLKKIFAKTGVKRQTELTQLLTASVARLEDGPFDDDGSSG